jgi:hypothetical protein
LFEKYHTDVIVGTHTGLHWHREPSSGKHFINCGVIGRPPNDGQRTVVYTIVNAGRHRERRETESASSDMSAELRSRFRHYDGNAYRLEVDFVRLTYDYERLASEMASEGLPDEFIETIRTGWWTTCNEILPAKERGRGIY